MEDGALGDDAIDFLEFLVDLLVLLVVGEFGFGDEAEVLRLRGGEVGGVLRGGGDGEAEGLFSHTNVLLG